MRNGYNFKSRSHITRNSHYFSTSSLNKLLHLPHHGTFQPNEEEEMAVCDRMRMHETAS